MAKINEILVNGVLTQVTEFDHTAQEIDDAVSIVGTSPAETRLNIGAASNPNLLDNWYFAGPIDQRGGYVVPPNTPYWSAMVDGTSPGNTDAYYKVTVNATRSDWYEFTMNGTVYYVPDFHVVRGYCGGGTYSIDRWKKDGSNTVVLVTDDGYGLIPEVGDKGFYQPFENPKDILNQIVTLSIFVKAENTAQVKIGFGGGGGYCEPVEIGTEWTIVQFAHTFTTGANFAVHSMTAGEKIIVKAAKLELGDTQTLAHKDANGNWVLNEIPDYGEELAKCQRYQFPLRSSGPVPIGTSVADGNGAISIRYELPVPMRTTPSMVPSTQTFRIHGPSVDYVNAVPNAYPADDEHTALYLYFSGFGGVPNEPYFVDGYPSVNVMFDANL